MNLHDVTRCHLKAVRLPIPPPGRGRRNYTKERRIVERVRNACDGQSRAARCLLGVLVSPVHESTSLSRRGCRGCAIDERSNRANQASWRSYLMIELLVREPGRFERIISAAAIETRVTLASKAGQAEYTQPYIYTAGVVRKLCMTRLFQWHTGRLVETELYGVIVGPTAGAGEQIAAQELPCMHDSLHSLTRAGIQARRSKRCTQRV